MTKAKELVVMSPAKPNRYASVDSKLGILEMLSADISGNLARTKLRQFSTYRTIDIDELERLADPRHT